MRLIIFFASLLFATSRAQTECAYDVLGAGQLCSSYLSLGNADSVQGCYELARVREGCYDDGKIIFMVPSENTDRQCFCSRDNCSSREGHLSYSIYQVGQCFTNTNTCPDGFCPNGVNTSGNACKSGYEELCLSDEYDCVPGVVAETGRSGTGRASFTEGISNAMVCAEACFNDPECESFSFSPGLEPFDWYNYCYTYHTSRRDIIRGSNSLLRWNPSYDHFYTCERPLSSDNTPEPTVVSTTTSPSLSPTVVTCPEDFCPNGEGSSGEKTCVTGYDQLCLAAPEFDCVGGTAIETGRAGTGRANTITNIASPEMCAQQCFNDPQCQMFSFSPGLTEHTWRNYCYIYHYKRDDIVAGSVSVLRWSSTDYDHFYSCTRPWTDSEVLFTYTGDCDSEQNCISSAKYPSLYGNSQYCTVNILHDVFVAPASRFSVETCCDNLLINNVDVDSAAKVPETLTAGTTFTWRTDGSVTRVGWQLCFTANSAIVETSQTTAGPTTSPTSGPTPRPTPAPTEQPTSSPTETPSSSPTETPSSSPTERPSSSPTERPSSSPTETPSFSPSERPSSSPTDHPSTSPTDHPSSSPTDHPSSLPTTHPSTYPTTCPTFFPTTNPTEKPTAMPSMVPSKSPTISIETRISQLEEMMSSVQWQLSDLRNVHQQLSDLTHRMEQAESEIGEIDANVNHIDDGLTSIATCAAGYESIDKEEEGDLQTEHCAAITNPCGCVGDCGWSTENDICGLASEYTTVCTECDTLEGCITGSCLTLSDDLCPVEYNEMRICQCNDECRDYGNCCWDVTGCGGDNYERVDIDLKCDSGAMRTFKLDFTSVENCAQRCAADNNCDHFATDLHRFCIGCVGMPTNEGIGFHAYRMTSTRRRLSLGDELIELRRMNAKLLKVNQALREENEELKK